MSVTFHIEKETLYIQKSQGKRKKGKEKRIWYFLLNSVKAVRIGKFFFLSPIITDSLTWDIIAPFQSSYCIYKWKWWYHFIIKQYFQICNPQVALGHSCELVTFSFWFSRPFFSNVNYQGSFTDHPVWSKIFFWLPKLLGQQRNLPAKQ